MSWEKLKLGDFLINRENRFKPNDKSISGFKRIDKIDFSGKIFLSDKPSNTDMILVKKGDLVISGINVEKGAMSVYHGDENVTATIHYSSYRFDEKKIDIDFLKMFLRSPEFKNALKEQVPGGIKTEIKPKHLLPLEVVIPNNISEQKEVVKSFANLESQNTQLETELFHQQDLLKQLRQSFLREAMQGKLVKQNPKEGKATDLLKKIKSEKEKLITEKKLKKDKPLPPIKEEEIPFSIPENWVWCKLGEIVLNISTGPFGTMLHKSDYVANGIPLVNPMNVVNEKIVPSSKMMINEKTKQRLKSYILKVGDVVVGRRGEMGRCAVITENENGWLCGTGSFFLELQQDIYSTYFIKVLSSDFAKSILLGSSVGATMNNLNHKILSNLLIPLPPLQEQKRIVNKLEEVMNLCDELKTTVTNDQNYTHLLLQVALKDALRKEEVIAK